MSHTLDRRTVLIVHAHRDVDVFIEGLRDLGTDLTEAGEAVLRRVAELDATSTVAPTPEPGRTAEISASLARISDELHHAIEHVDVSSPTND